MAKGYRHPTHGERRQIHALKESRLSIPAIARRPSGISTQRQGPPRRRNRSLPGSACLLPRFSAASRSPSALQPSTHADRMSNPLPR